MIKILENMLVDEFFSEIKDDIVFDNINKSSSNCKNSSIRFDAMNQKYLGRIILWQSGDMNVEILDVETIEVVDAKTCIVKSKENILTEIQTMITIMKNI
ncbi:MAG: hypothetical protein JEZ08_24835 [Clostridiales bacterium]|nr:hypothetical protein [Clostridiales bacterium]